jgi:hypothetical protein
MKNTEQYLRNLLKRSINETLESKTDKLMGKIKEMEMGEGFDSPEIKFDRDGRDYDKDEFKKYRFRPYEFENEYDLDSTTEDEFNYRVNTRDIDLDELLGDDDDLDPYIKDEDDIDPITEGENCEQCGSKLVEGECERCENIYEETYDLNPDNKFDYVEEYDDYEDDYKDRSMYDPYYGDDDYVEEVGEEFDDEEWEDRTNEICRENPDSESCKYHKEKFKTISEGKKLVGNQKKLDKNKNNKIDAEDFKLLRKSKKVKSDVDEEMEEGNEFTGALAKAKKGGKKEFEVGGKTFPVKESTIYYIQDNDGDIIKLTENELVNLIENIVLEQKTPGLKTIGKPKGLTTYEKAHKGSGKENQEYLKSVSKKMKDYLKDGSKGEYSMEPKIFPKGNGELAKMSKKAYVPSGAVQDYVDNFTAASLENLDYDGISPNEDWVSDLVKGASKTGNNPKWGNAVETGVNDKRDKIRKDNLLGKAKKKAYNKAPQPIVTDKTGEDEGDKIMRRLESIDDKSKTKINEEFSRMKQLLSYNRKTQ